jgi:hypothetical protein
MLFWVKIVITIVLTVGVAEFSKYNARAGALVNALPLQSLIIIVWLFVDTKNISQVDELSRGMLWALPGTFLFFVALTVAIKIWGTLWPALATASVVSGAGYFLLHLARRMLVKT